MTQNTYPWEQLEGEPDEAYNWFMKYYVPLGLRRSKRGAFRLFVMENNPRVFVAGTGPQSAPDNWSVAFDLFNWESRALAFDRDQMKESFEAVKQAALEIRLAAPDAVKALIRELASTRNGVAAAKEILDRAGVETAAIVRETELSADDYAKAEQELQEWMKEHKNENG